MKREIKAEVVEASVCPRGHKIITYQLTAPRYILAEINTHRDFSRNSASSRAISFEKMLESVQTDPFIPLVWQKDHKGMQGTEYVTDPKMIQYRRTQWLMLRNWAVMGATNLHTTAVTRTRGRLSVSPHGELAADGDPITKQFCNRAIEPYLWHTILLTTTEIENFFKQRCPQYTLDKADPNQPTFRSWKDLVKYCKETLNANSDWVKSVEEATILTRMQTNLSGADVHIQLLAESMWDEYNSADWVQKQEGEWHIPGVEVDEEDYKYFLMGGGIPDAELTEVLKLESETETEAFATMYETHEWLEKYSVWVNRAELKQVSEAAESFDKFRLRLAVGSHARISFMNHLKKLYTLKSMTADVHLHDRLAVSRHWSAFEHCAQVPTNDVYRNNIRGSLYALSGEQRKDVLGWFGNFHGWVQYRKLFNNEDGKA